MGRLNIVIKAAMTAALALAAVTAQAQKASPDAEDRMIERRAVEAVIWGMPAVNYDLMYQAGLRNKAAPNQIVYWSRLPDWKNQTLTPNPGAICLMPFINTKDGPMVLEIPPASEDRSPAIWMTPGKSRWRTSARLAPTRGTAANI